MASLVVTIVVHNSVNFNPLLIYLDIFIIYITKVTMLKKHLGADAILFS